MGHPVRSPHCHRCGRILHTPFGLRQTEPKAILRRRNKLRGRNRELSNCALPHFIHLRTMDEEWKQHVERLKAIAHKLERLNNLTSMEPLDTNSRISSSVKSLGKSFVDAVKMPFRLN